MKNTIELKNIKRSEFASQETHCYEASLYFNGKRIGVVSNDGHGGCDNEHIIDKAGWDEMRSYIESLPPHKYDGGELPQDLEIICGELLNQWLIKKELNKALKRKVIFLTTSGELLHCQYKGKREPDYQLMQHVKASHEGAQILNTMPIDKAVQIYESKAA